MPLAGCMFVGGCVSREFPRNLVHIVVVRVCMAWGSETDGGTMNHWVKTICEGTVLSGNPMSIILQQTQF